MVRHLREPLDGTAIGLGDKRGEAGDLEGALHAPGEAPRGQRARLPRRGGDRPARPLGHRADLDGASRRGGHRLQLA